MIKLILLALFALCGALAADLTADVELDHTTGDDITEMTEEALPELLGDDTTLAGRDLLGFRDRKFIKGFFKKEKKDKKKKPKKPIKKKGKKVVKKTSSKKFFVKTKKTTVSKAKCKAVATAKTKTDARKKLVVAIAKAIAIGCGAKGHIKIKKIVKVLNKATIAVAKATTSAFAKCVSKGNAYGCAAAHAEAEAYAKGLALVIADAYAIAANKCHYCVGVKAASFTKAIDVIKVFIWAESKASAYVCVKGNAKAVAYEKCFAKTIAVAFARAIAKAFLKTGGSCYKDAKAKAAVETEVETGYIEKVIGKCKSFTKTVKYKKPKKH